MFFCTSAFPFFLLLASTTTTRTTTRTTISKLSAVVDQQSQSQSNSLPPKRRSYSERTASRRKRTNHLLESILPPPHDDHGHHHQHHHDGSSLDEVSQNIPILKARSIDWDSIHPTFDPQQGGKLQKDTPRSRRKRLQIEAFVHLCREILSQQKNDDDNDDDDKRSLLVDAGSGAGNLAIPLAGILERDVLAIDINPFALDRLESRIASSNCRVTTLCADLGDTNNIELPTNSAIVCSLHACGAATDMAMNIATHHRLPFIMSPCCTGKANVVRPTPSLTKHGLPQPATTSQERSGAPTDIVYPRSQWLRSSLQLVVDSSSNNNNNSKTNSNYADETHHHELPYVTLAKVADVGLGPQTPVEQIRHQRLAKFVIEMDRLMAVVESHDYIVQLWRLEEHDNYGKAEIFCGIPKEHPAAAAAAAMARQKKLEE